MAILPFEGLQEKVEAGINSLASENNYAESLANIRQDKEMWDIEKNMTLKSAGLPTWTDEALEVIGGISADVVAGNALGISKKLSTLSAGARRGMNAIIGATEAGTLSNTKTGYLIGGTIGLIAPSLVKAGFDVSKGIGKQVGKVIPDKAVAKASKKIGDLMSNIDEVKILKNIKSKSIEEIGTNKDYLKIAKKGTKASKQTAAEFGRISKEGKEQFSKNVSDITEQTFGTDIDISGINESASRNYNDVVEEIKFEKFSKKQLDNIKKSFKSKSAVKEFDDAIRIGNYNSESGVNSFDSINEAKKHIDQRIRQVNMGTNEGSIRRLTQVKKTLNDALSEVSPDFKAAQKQFSVGKKIESAYSSGIKSNIKDYTQADWVSTRKTISEFKTNAEKSAYRQGFKHKLNAVIQTGGDDANTAKKILKYKELIKEVLPKGESSAFFKKLEKQNKVFEGLNKIAKYSEAGLEQGSIVCKNLHKLKKNPVTYVAAATGLINAPAAVGMIGAETVGGIVNDLSKSKAANKLVSGSTEIDPFVQAIMARQLGGFGQ
jgi:hypothetical protein